VSRQKLQLVGITALFTACKYEEIYPPDLRDFVYVTDKAYTKKQILQMEGKMLKELNFNITFSSAYLFLQRYSKLMQSDQKTYLMARYLIELAQVEYGLIKYSPSHLAASAIYLAGKIFKLSNIWNDKIAGESSYSEQEIDTLSQLLSKITDGVNRKKLNSVYRKFSKNKY
jgi:cyclin B